jgi:hypothetical protein
MFLLSVSELRLGNYLTASRRAREAFNLTVDFPKNNVQSDFLAKNIQQGLAKSCCEYWQNGPNIGFASISPPSNKNSNKTSARFLEAILLLQHQQYITPERQSQLTLRSCVRGTMII